MMKQNNFTWQSSFHQLNAETSPFNALHVDCRCRKHLVLEQWDDLWSSSDFKNGVSSFGATNRVDFT
jgi:hypothetical protein